LTTRRGGEAVALLTTAVLKSGTIDPKAAPLAAQVAVRTMSTQARCFLKKVFSVAQALAPDVAM